MLMKSKTLNKNIKVQERPPNQFMMVISNRIGTYVMLKLPLLLKNMKSAIGAESTP